MSNSEIKLEGPPKLITGIMEVVNTLNKEPKFNFKYSEVLNDSLSTIAITAPRPEDFYILGGACFMFLKTELQLELHMQMIK